MSIKLMSEVWALDMRPTDKLVLLALADNANDEGTAWPSMATMCAKTSLSERAVRNALRHLEEQGFLCAQERTGRSTVYTVTPARGAPRHVVPPTPAPDAPPPRHVVPPRGARGAPITIIEPSIESSENHKSAREREFDRVKAAYPEGLYPEADWLVAEKSCETLIERGQATWFALISAAEQYRAQAIASDRVPNYVSSPAKFFGSPKWRGPFPLPKSKAQTRQDKNVDVAQRWLDANQ